MRSSTINLPAEVVQQTVQFLCRVAPVPQEERNQLIQLVEYLEAQIQSANNNGH